MREGMGQPSAGAGGGLDAKMLRAEYDALSADEQLPFEQRAALRAARAPFWHDEAKHCLQHTNGKGD